MMVVEFLVCFYKQIEKISSHWSCPNKIFWIVNGFPIILCLFLTFFKYLLNGGPLLTCLQFLPEPTFAAEQRLFEYFIDARVYLMPGKKSYCPSPGWFRLVIASDKNRVLEGMHKMLHIIFNWEMKFCFNRFRLRTVTSENQAMDGLETEVTPFF